MLKIFDEEEKQLCKGTIVDKRSYLGYTNPSLFDFGLVPNMIHVYKLETSDNHFLEVETNSTIIEKGYEIKIGLTTKKLWKIPISNKKFIEYRGNKIPLNRGAIHS